MKKEILFIITFALLACSKSDNIIPIPSRGHATFKVDSVEKTFTKSNSFNNGILALGDSTDDLISLSFPVPQSFPTTYNMDTEDLISASYILDGKTYNATNGILGIGKKGTLVIIVTAYNSSKISGTFTFTAITDNNEQIIIKEGMFVDIPDL